MPPAPQKSFFERNHAGQGARPSHWHPEATAHNPASRRDAQASVGCPVRAPAAEISSETKSKLKAFVFNWERHQTNIARQARKNMEAREGGERVAQAQENEANNIGGGVAKDVQLAGSTPIDKAAIPEQAGLNTLHAKVPQTPTSRVPLAELLGSNEETVSRPVREPTPEDKVCWRHQRSPSSTYVPTFYLRRGKKRARSSSPLPSPCRPHGQDPEAKDTLNLDSLQRSLDTPKADTTTDLWGGLCTKGRGGEGISPLIPFSPLLVASPRTSAGLRRTMSGGIEWPIQKAKRRKILQDAEDPEEVQQRHLAEQHRAAKKARVSELLQRVQRGLSGAPTTVDVIPEESSSSPLPGEPSDAQGMPPSPLQFKMAMPKVEVAEDEPAAEVESVEEGDAHQDSDRSSEFGGLDLDDMDLGILDSIGSGGQSAANPMAASMQGPHQGSPAGLSNHGNHQLTRPTSSRRIGPDCHSPEACPQALSQGQISVTAGAAEPRAGVVDDVDENRDEGDEEQQSDNYSDDFLDCDDIMGAFEDGILADIGVLGNAGPKPINDAHPEPSPLLLAPNQVGASVRSDGRALQASSGVRQGSVPGHHPPVAPGEAGPRLIPPVTAPSAFVPTRGAPVPPLIHPGNNQSRFDVKDDGEEDEFGDISDDALEAAAAEVFVARGNTQHDGVVQRTAPATATHAVVHGSGAVRGAAGVRGGTGGSAASSAFSILGREINESDQYPPVEASTQSPERRQKRKAATTTSIDINGQVKIFCDHHEDAETLEDGTEETDSKTSRKRIQRYCVMGIEEGQYEMETSAGRKYWARQKILFVQDQDDRPKMRNPRNATSKSERGSQEDGRTPSSCHTGSYSNNSTDISTSVDSLSEDDTKMMIILRQSWVETRCAAGDYVHLIGSFEAQEDIDHNKSSPGPRFVAVVDDQQNMIILHPDHLISATVVADSFGCVRRAVLQDRVKATNEPSEAQVYGKILHEIFQAGLKANRWDGEWLGGTVVQEIVRRHHLEDLYLINVDLPQAFSDLKGKVAEFEAWAKLFVGLEPKPEAVVGERNGKRATLAINKLLDVEEHVWSPMYGLKGNIDATVQTVVEDEDDDDGPGDRQNLGARKTLLVPLEFKTGRNTSDVAHRAQTSLYTLLLSDRYDVDVACGLLYYMETSNMTRIQSMRNELRHLIIQRNELACFVRDRLQQLPPMLKRPHTCGRCYAKVPCFVYHKLVDGGDSRTAGFGPDQEHRFNEVVGHLTPTHQAFFKHWDDLLTKEEGDMVQHRRELWTMLSTERERLGRCFANVVIEPGSFVEDVDAPKVYRYRYNLIRQVAGSGVSTSTSFLDSQLVVGEPIVISDEAGHFALANGFVTHVGRRKITVSVDRKLQQHARRQTGFDEKRNQVFKGIMEVAKDGEPDGVEHVGSGGDGGPSEPVLYRLDKDEFNNGMATVRNNLVQIMTDSKVGCREIRELVVDGRSPTFESRVDPLTDDESSLSPAAPAGAGLDQRLQVQAENTESATVMNPDQQRAIEKVMTANDYALVLGMPGTGKTTTIAHIIRALVKRGKSVLLTSYTHTAVDNILLKLRPQRSDGRSTDTTDMSILRLGAIAKIHPEVQHFATLAANLPKQLSHSSASIQDLHRAYHSPPIVATTCLGINHAVFQTRVFDYCIVDEASQITVPVCLGPIRMARRFVLVGDHNQLPPLVQNEEARTGGLDVSLFKMLSDRHPHAVVRLAHQYRMCKEIMEISNTLIYGGVLRCGAPAVAERSLVVPHLEEGLRAFHASCSSRAQQDRPLQEQQGNMQRRRSPSTTPSPTKKHHPCPLSPPPPSPSASLQQTTCLYPLRGPLSASAFDASTPTCCWIQHLVQPSTKVCFVNTDALGPVAREEARGSRIINALEARLCSQIVEALRCVGVPGHEIGLMTVYRSQLALLRQTVRRLGPSRREHAYAGERGIGHDGHGGYDKDVAGDGAGAGVGDGDGDGDGDRDRNEEERKDVEDARDTAEDIEMHTTDKFQGRDKEVIILSLVRSNDGKNIGDLLKDWRRINVALTRARTKLIVLGSKDTLMEDELLARFFRLVDERGWTLDLARGAHELHGPPARPDGTQTQTQRQKPVLEVQPAAHRSEGASTRHASTPETSPGRRRLGPRGAVAAAAAARDEGEAAGGKENVSRGSRVPEKRGQLSRVLLGSRPVLRDLVNDLA